MNVQNKAPIPERDPMLDHAVAALKAMSRPELQTFVEFHRFFHELPKPRRVVLVMIVHPGIQLVRLACLVSLSVRQVQRMAEYKRRREQMRGFSPPDLPTKRRASNRGGSWSMGSPDE